MPYTNGSRLLAAGSLAFFDDPNIIVTNTVGSIHKGLRRPESSGLSSLAAQTTPNFQTFDMYYWSAFVRTISGLLSG